MRNVFPAAQNYDDLLYQIWYQTLVVCVNVFAVYLQVAEALLEKETLTYKDMEQLIGPPTFGKSLRYDWRSFSKTSTPTSESPVTS